LYAHAGFHYGIVRINCIVSNNVRLSYRMGERVFLYNDKVFHDIHYVLDPKLKKEIIEEGGEDKC